jgi:hypothetical protein
MIELLGYPTQSSFDAICPIIIDTAEIMPNKQPHPYDTQKAANQTAAERPGKKLHLIDNPKKVQCRR